MDMNKISLFLTVSTDLDLCSTAIKNGIITDEQDIQQYHKADEDFAESVFSSNKQLMKDIHNRFADIFNRILEDDKKADKFSNIVLHFYSQAKGQFEIANGMKVNGDCKPLYPCFTKIN